MIPATGFQQLLLNYSLQKPGQVKAYLKVYNFTVIPEQFLCTLPPCSIKPVQALSYNLTGIDGSGTSKWQGGIRSSAVFPRPSSANR